MILLFVTDLSLKWDIVEKRGYLLREKHFRSLDLNYTVTFSLKSLHGTLEVNVETLSSRQYLNSHVFPALRR